MKPIQIFILFIALGVIGGFSLQSHWRQREIFRQLRAIEMRLEMLDDQGRIRNLYLPELYPQ